MTEDLARAKAAFAAGDFATALDSAWRAAERPAANDALVLLVNAATRLGALDDAIFGLERLLLEFPDNVQFRRMLATALNKRALRQADRAAARADLDRALAVWPDDPNATFNRVEMLVEDGARNVMDGQRAQAARAFARAAALTQDGRRAPGLRAEIAQRLSLEPVHADRNALATARMQFDAGLRSLESEFGPARLARCDQTLDQVVWSNFLLAYHGEDDLALQSRYGDWLSGFTARFASRDVSRAVPRRIGIVSSFLRDSTVGAYFGSWIGALSQAGFEVVLFALGPRFDATTDAFAARAQSLVRLDGSLDAMADTIAGARCAALLYPELGMDGRVFALASTRLAPRQWMAWGHPVTSGLPTIDLAFTASAMEPADGASHYRERLVGLPGLGTSYRAPAQVPAPSRGELGLPRGRLYLVPQAAFKIHPDNDAIFAELLARDPDGRLILFGNECRSMTERLRARLARAFAPHDVDIDRARFLPMTSRSRYLAINRACDVMVDTLHWSGGNTSLDALAAGLPIVTCAGRFMRGRQTASMLSMLGLERFIAERPENIADLAIEVAGGGDIRRQFETVVADRLPDLRAGRAALAAFIEAVEASLAGP